MVTIGSYVNKYSNETNGCTPTGINPATGGNLYSGVKAANGCANKILVSVSKEAYQQGLGLKQILLLLPYVLPEALRFSVPGTILFATCSVYGRMASTNEITREAMMKYYRARLNG